MMVSAGEVLRDVAMGTGGAGSKFNIAKAQHLIWVLGQNNISEWPGHTAVSHCSQMKGQKH